MATRRPLVLINGSTQELPLADTLPGIPTVMGLAADLFDDSSTARTIFTIPVVASSFYTFEAVLTCAGDSSNIGIILALNLPTGATSTFSFIGPVADNNVLVQGTANNSGNFAGTGNWIGGNTKACIHVRGSFTIGTTAGNVLLVFQKNGSGTARVYRPSSITINKL